MDRKQDISSYKKLSRLAYCKYGDAVSQIERILTRDDRSTIGGPDIFLASVLELTQGHQLLVMSYHNRDAEIVASTITAKVFDRYPSLRSRIGRTIRWMTLSIKTFYSLIRFRPTIILCAATDAVLWTSYVICKLSSIPLVATRHARLIDESSTGLKSLTNKINARIIRHANAIVCHGPYLRAELIELGVNQDKVIEFDNSHRLLLDYISTGTQLNKSNDYVYILYVGQLIKQKGIYDLLFACEKSLRHNSRLRLIYAGAGQESKYLQEKVNDLGLRSQVILLGQVEYSSIPNLVYQSLFVVTPTQSAYPEARCEAAIEGLTLGKPVIAPNYGPFPYLVKHNLNGLLFEPNSWTDLQLNIQKLLEDNVLYEKLKSGAGDTAKDLLDPKITYLEALKLAFEGYK